MQTKISKAGPDGEGGFLEHGSPARTTGLNDNRADADIIELSEQSIVREGRGDITVLTTIDIETERIDG